MAFCSPELQMQLVLLFCYTRCLFTSTTSPNICLHGYVLIVSILGLGNHACDTLVASFVICIFISRVFESFFSFISLTLPMYCYPCFGNLNFCFVSVHSHTESLIFNLNYLFQYILYYSHFLLYLLSRFTYSFALSIVFYKLS